MWRTASKRLFFPFSCALLGLISFKFETKEISFKETKIKINTQNQKLEKKCDPVRLEIKNEISREFQKALEKEKEQKQSTSEALNVVEQRLMDRQWDFCSLLVRRVKVVELEKDLLVYTAKQPLAHLQMEDGLRDIFKNDQTCANFRNTDKRRNGSLMWLYLKYWRLQLALQTHQRAEAAILNSQTKEWHWESRWNQSVSLKWCILKDPIVNKVNKIRFCYIGFFVGGANSDLYLQ